ncbi:hypothetical protein DPMN_146345 [Dreissena polymorpha]|uniref:Uncharacterized protein n=1 Tax=Dreissena polymorpha TaxID=45954 RepID=A0A9D4IYC1_DREPO|nr:hypothetical protein DPMN_146345 [Dreissena polymorpha]
MDTPALCAEVAVRPSCPSEYRRASIALWSSPLRTGTRDRRLGDRTAANVL